MDEELTARDLEMLEFERLTWRYPGAKETAILDRFEMSATRYYQVLLDLIDRPAAEASPGMPQEKWMQTQEA